MKKGSGLSSFCSKVWRAIAASELFVGAGRGQTDRRVLEYFLPPDSAAVDVSPGFLLVRVDWHRIPELLQLFRDRLAGLRGCEATERRQ